MNDSTKNKSPSEMAKEKRTVCPNCGYENHANHTKCWKCGFSLKIIQWKVCENCGENVRFDYSICPYCNSPSLKAVESMGNLPYFSPLDTVDDNDGIWWKICPRCAKKVNKAVFRCPFCHNVVFEDKKVDLNDSTNEASVKNNGRGNFFHNIVGWLNNADEYEAKPNPLLEVKSKPNGTEGDYANKTPMGYGPKRLSQRSTKDNRSKDKALKGKHKPVFNSYKLQANRLKSKFELKEKKARELIEKRFPSPQITNDKFNSILDECCEVFTERFDVVMTMVDSSSEYSLKIEEEIKSNIGFLKQINYKLDSLTDELLIGMSGIKKNDVEDLLDEIDLLTDSLKDYD